MSLTQPLQGVRVIEFEGLGPGPMAGRILAGMGAHVTCLIRPDPGSFSKSLNSATDNPLREGKQVVPLDLKTPQGLSQALEYVANADVLIEGNRPGVMERLGLGPDTCLARNPRLIFARMTGWGQDGPLALAAGHDLNYVALTGLLSLAARSGEGPIVPPTVMGDASGALGLAFGVACALADVKAGGPGRVVDAAIVDVLSMLGMLAQHVRAHGMMDGPAPSPFHDSPYYDTYECADGKFVTVAAMEPQFYDKFLSKLGLTEVDRASQNDVSKWPQLKSRVANIFRSRDRDTWCQIMEGTDVCFAPVLSMSEAANHPHNQFRKIYRKVGDSGELRPAIAPRFLSLSTSNSSL